ncbi:MAG: hypothetical protein R2815_06790 [Flavobacteriales bacterium]
MIRAHGAERAEVLLCELIRNYARAIGEEDMFDRALTITATRIIAICMMRSIATDFGAFHAEFPKLSTGFRALVAAYEEGGSRRLRSIL